MTFSLTFFCLLIIVCLVLSGAVVYLRETKRRQEPGCLPVKTFSFVDDQDLFPHLYFGCLWILLDSIPVADICQVVGRLEATLLLWSRDLYPGCDFDTDFVTTVQIESQEDMIRKLITPSLSGHQDSI